LTIKNRTGDNKVIMEQNLILKKIEKIIQDSISKDCKIFLFGSWARGNAAETSDIDIGILGKEKVPFAILVKIFNKAEEIPTLRSIDIVDLAAKDKEYKKNVLKYAKILK